MIFLVIPCYRESGRLPAFLPQLCEALRRAGITDVVIQPVDDGSPDDDSEKLQKALAPISQRFPEVRPVHRLTQNQGKGGAVYSGWDLGVDLPQVTWLAFIDADGAVPGPEAARILQMIQSAADSPEPGAYFAQRLAITGYSVQRTWLRELSGQAFRWVVRSLFDLPVEDTQCGFKVVPRLAYQTIRPFLRERRFTFDVELAVRLTRSGIKITGVPINWSESPGTTVRGRTIFEMLASLLRVRRALDEEKAGSLR